MKKTRVCVVTGTRAEFGIWRAVLAAILKSKRLALQLVVTGTHLMPVFGETVNEIEAAGIEIAARVEMYRDGEDSAESLARGISGLAQAYRAVKADIVLVLGDRLEMLAAATAALAERIPIGHVHGGETAPGVWDEQIRHAITKMSQVHFCATETARRRIVRMAEDSRRVHLVGAPALDVAVAFMQRLRNFERTSAPARLLSRLVTENRSPLVLLHPTSSDELLEYRRTRLVIKVLRRVFPHNAIQTIGSNNDPGHRGIRRAYAEWKDRHLHDESPPQVGFWAMLLGSGLLVGNSSAGIIEAATLGVPVVNIGGRQAGRERNANVIDVGWDAKSLEAGLRKAVGDRAFLRRVALRKNLYGDGRSAERIVSVLEGLARDKTWGLAKRFVD